MPTAKNCLFARVYENCCDAVLRFREDQGGNIAILFAATIIPAIIAVGAAIDYSRASQVKTAMQTALDSTALHLGLLPQSSSQAVLETEAANYFAANYQGESDVNLGTIRVLKDGPAITLTLDADLPTMFMGIANINQMDVGAISEVLLGGGTIEIALVLDNSGSMGGSKIAALKNAANGLVETLYDSLPPNSTDLSFSLVPFATFVGVGTGNANASWMDTQALSPIHNENFDTPSNRFNLFNNLRNAQWEGCVEARPYPHDVLDTTPDQANPETLFVPAFAPDTPNLKRNERVPTTNNYIGDGNYGSWLQRQENVAKYLPNSRISGAGPSRQCDQQNLSPLSTSQSDIQRALRAMVARGNTNIIQGLVWGWRTLSPAEPFTQGRAYGDNRNQKILIVLTDGQNYIQGINNINRSVYSAYGFAKDNRLGTTSRSNSVLNAAMNARTAEACANIKNTEILIYTITFGLNDAATLRLMENCATSSDYYYNSPSTSQLDEVFDEIASKLLKLRLTK